MFGENGASARMHLVSNADAETRAKTGRSIVDPAHKPGIGKRADF